MLIEYNTTGNGPRVPSNRKAAGEPGGLKAVVYLRGVLIGLLETKMTTTGVSKMNLFSATNSFALILAALEP